MRIESIADLSKWIHAVEGPSPGQTFVPTWFRGQADKNWLLAPEVERGWFRARAKEVAPLLDSNEAVRVAEASIFKEFRLEGRPLLPATDDFVEDYFFARHHGLPTRLLDWTEDAAAALFFCCSGQPTTDGALYAMSPRDLFPLEEGGYKMDVLNEESVRKVINQITDPQGDDAEMIAHYDQTPCLPVRPTARAGRIFSQKSRFTVHLPDPSLDQPRSYFGTDNESIKVATIPADAKQQLQGELRRLGTNWFSLFGDLDHLAKEVRSVRMYFPPRNQ